MEISDNNSDCYIKLPQRSILVFGGSFNPVHQGHLELITNLLKLRGEPEILVIPAAQSPFKSREDLIPAEIRWRLLEIALPKNPRLHLLDNEVNRSGISYSYETWQQLCEEYRPENWFWVFGSDTFAEFDRWHRADEFVKKNNSFSNNQEEDFEFNQDIDFENEIRSPGWLRYQKKLK
ncbi:MAG: nicotinate-nicotinamide nucleotide adenylyltransferase [SAR324 cluster bacterium]|nr:nicotinate-nicotinamide nucleotide adenylyltransferase [SAR324 cluster bacterium]